MENQIDQTTPNVSDEPYVSTETSSRSVESSVLVTNMTLTSSASVLPRTVLTESDSDTSYEIEDDASSQTSTNVSTSHHSNCKYGGYTHPEFESDFNPNDPPEVDPYADVRERMERLARADRDKHFHLVSSKSSHDHTNSKSGKGKKAARKPQPFDVSHDKPSFFTAYTTYIGYAVLILYGHIRDLCANVFKNGRYLRTNRFESEDLSRYAPLLKSWENFYTRRIYHRIQDCFNRPLGSNPGPSIDVLERVSENGNKSMKIFGTGFDSDTAPSSTSESDSNSCVNSNRSKVSDDYMSGKYATRVHDSSIARKCLNLGSYNYLGFGNDWNETCAASVLPCVENIPVSCTSSRLEFGNTKYHEELEGMLAEFLGKEAAFVHNMGFNTNSTTIPALVGKGDLIISDELNHTSIVNGARGSGANIRIFNHNDERHLEEVIRDAIVMGRPRTRRPFGKILVVVEGIYSMEGEYCRLGPINRICKKYGAYLYLDEAHSIGAMGPTGRGCSEYWGVTDVDIMMGTFSKSFGGMGGYVAGRKEVIEGVRAKCSGSIYHNSLSPIICQQVITAFNIIMGKDGTTLGKQKLKALRDNSNYFRMRLADMGLQILGNYDSPVMPMMLFNPTKIPAFSRECFKRGVAVVVVGFPAVPILLARARFCLSASHKRQELDIALKAIEDVADTINLRYERSPFG